MNEQDGKAAVAGICARAVPASSKEDRDLFPVLRLLPPSISDPSSSTCHTSESLAAQQMAVLRHCTK